MRRLTALLALLAVLLAVAGLALAVVISTRRPPDDAPPAAGVSRRLAAPPPLDDVAQDQGNSVPLPDGRTLWIFADSAHLNEPPTFFLTSTAAITRRGGLQLRYLADAAGTPQEFLPRTPAERADQVPGRRYTAVWPTGATALPDGRILVAYAKYRVQGGARPRYDFLAGGLYEYRYPGPVTVGAAPVATRIADDIWSANDGPVASPLHYQGHVYFFRCEDFRCLSARVPVGAETDRSRYTWWDGASWGPRLAARPLTFGSDVPGRNPPVAFDSRTGVFVMTDTSGGIPTGHGRLWVARQPWGPWSRAAGFALPQCPADGCYTLNVHPHASPDETLRVSFATDDAGAAGPFVRVVDVPVRIDVRGDVPAVRVR